ncbi:MAG: glycoside hydrolase family 16 protein [Verrucomicrobia bacterium]|nr:glycoside hydrolase family 16 protein [Verrucomicrobiota bacterium]
MILAAHFMPLLGFAQSIEFTHVPPIGASELVEAKISGVNFAKYGVAMIIDVFGAKWTKPLSTTPNLPINVNGTFKSIYVTGGQDACAGQIFLYVVPRDYAVPVLTGQGSIPQEIEDHAVAKAVADRLGSGQEITFAGRAWGIKDTGACIWGPGPNHFSGRNVRVDNQGKLHLLISNTNGVWYCPEIILKDSLGYGTYRFSIDSDVRDLPGPIVVGCFTYDDDPAFSHREMDFEFSNGDVVGRNAPWQFVVQPYFASGQRFRYKAPTVSKSSAYSLTWLPATASFASYDAQPSYLGTYESTYSLQWKIEPARGKWFDLKPFTATTSMPTNWVVTDRSGSYNSRYFRTQLTGLYEVTDRPPVVRWTAMSGVPPKGNEKVHINMWLFNGLSPGNPDETYEVVVSDFQFKPISVDLNSLRPGLKVLDLRNPHSIDEELSLRVSLPAE